MESWHKLPIVPKWDEGSVRIREQGGIPFVNNDYGGNWVNFCENL
jgi:hypothetical protein